MYEQPSEELATPRRGRLGLKVALVGAGLVAGVIGATAIGASAESSAPSSSGSTTTTSIPDRPAGAPGSGDRGRGHGGATPVRSDEKSLPANVAAAVKAAALKAVPGATVYRVETDAGEGVYEAHLTKADGSSVTVKFDKELKVTKTETGMGTGDPAPAGRGDH